ncbi:MAG TPA: hypothetical protein VG649_21945 [Candidatus Angelobacter sp.]|nr:hypothetical protein [Candidatus Angelobacter sp.]
MASPFQFGVFIPVGPGLEEAERLADLLDSLWHYEPLVPWVLLIDDDLSGRNLTSGISVPPCCNLVTIPHPRRGVGLGITGGLCSANLIAMDWFAQNTQVDFFIKLDTDALVIRSFAPSLSRIFAGSQDAGLLGVIGRTCNPGSRLAGFYADATLALSQALYIANAAESGAQPFTAPLYIDGVGTVSPQQVQGFVRLKVYMDKALTNGYPLGMYCQGGAYAVSATLISRMQAQGYLESWREWLDLPFPEDIMMGIHTYAVGLKIFSCANVGDVFAIQHTGLPYHPERLIKEGYSIIHSLKNDEVFSETELRKLFREQRKAAVKSLDRNISSKLVSVD